MSSMSFALIASVLSILFIGGEAIPCPTGYIPVATGCYKVFNGLALKWSDARQTCINDSNTLTVNQTENAVTHLVALEREGEKNALFYWLKAYMFFDKQFWTDGVLSTSLWSWSNRSITWYFSADERAISGNGSNYKIIYSTTSLTSYQIADDVNSTIWNFICEYQTIVLCNESFTCQNGGTCYNNPGENICVCAPGYTGDQCEIEILECLSSPCLHDGVCIDEIDNYTCNCSATFYTGANCEILQPDPTQNQRSTAFWAVVGVVTGLVVLLTLSDLPWEDILAGLGCSFNCFKCCDKDENDAIIKENDYHISESPINDYNLGPKNLATFNGIPGSKRTSYQVMNTVWRPDQMHNPAPPKAEYNGYRSPDNGNILAKKTSEDERIYAVNINNDQNSKKKDPVDTMVSWTQELQDQLKNKKARETSASSTKQLIHSTNPDDY